MQLKNRLKAAIVQTLAYCDLFTFPLTATELWQRLYLSPPPKKVGKRQFRHVLGELLQKNQVAKKGIYYFLPGKEAICHLRQKRQRISQKKWQRLLNLVKLLTKLPTIQMIAVTGALAMNNAQENDDIDLLIITSRHRLWLTRILLIGLLEALGCRRRPHDRQVTNKVCLNMFLEETALKIPSLKQNLYTAYEVVQTRPVVERNQTYQRFWLANQDWIKEYLPNLQITSGQPSTRAQAEGLQALSRKRDIFGRLLDSLEKVAYYLQVWYMRSGKTWETVTPQMAFFHPKDIGQEILKRFKENTDRSLFRPKRGIIRL